MESRQTWGEVVDLVTAFSQFTAAECNNDYKKPSCR